MNTMGRLLGAMGQKLTTRCNIVFRFVGGANLLSAAICRTGIAVFFLASDQRNTGYCHNQDVFHNQILKQI